MATYTKSAEAVRERLVYMMVSRFEQYKAAKDIREFAGEGKNVLLSAEEKSGKRTIVEIVTLLDWEKYYMDGGKAPVNIYAVGLVRNDCKVQLDEMYDDYGIIAKSVNGKKDGEKILRDLAGDISNGANIHIDECDYASGKDQALAPFWKIAKECAGLIGILYSATPEEVSLSKDDDNVEHVVFQTSSDYCGAEFFLKNGLVHESKPFWDSDGNKWTDHGQALIDSLKENARSPDTAVCTRRVGVVRILSRKKNSETDYKKCFATLYGKEQDGINVKFVDMDHPFEWGNREAWVKNSTTTTNTTTTTTTTATATTTTTTTTTTPKALLLVICATCTRSTELAGHEFLKFWHDNRSLDKTDTASSAAFTTLSQALGRIKHYGANHIELYSDIRVYKLNCGCDDVSFDDVRRIAGRVKGRNVTVSVESSVCLETSWQDMIDNTPLVWKTNADLVNQGDTPASLFPGSGRSGFKRSSVTGKWTNSDSELRVMGDCKVKQAWLTQADHRHVLVYKSPDSEEFTMRVFMKDPNVDYNDSSDDDSSDEERDIVTRRHETTKSSMYSGGVYVTTPTTTAPTSADLSGIDRDIRSMRLPELRQAIRDEAKSRGGLKRGDLASKGNKADVQKSLMAIRQRAEVVENDGW